MINDSVRKSRPVSFDASVQTLNQFDTHEQKYSYSIPKRGSKLSGPLLDFDFLRAELSDKQPAKELPCKSRPSTVLYNFKESLNSLNDKFALSRATKRKKGCHRASVDLEINLKTCAFEVKDVTEAYSDDSEIQLVQCDKLLGYDSDASNFTTLSVQSDWDQHFHRNTSTD